MKINIKMNELEEIITYDGLYFKIAKLGTEIKELCEALMGNDEQRKIEETGDYFYVYKQLIAHKNFHHNMEIEISHMFHTELDNRGLIPEFTRITKLYGGEIKAHVLKVHDMNLERVRAAA